MKLQDLRYLLAVAEHGHFGRAAAACFVSQPTLSGQLRKLEENLGVVLFERTNRSVTITPIGSAMLEHARAAFEQVERIEALARAQRDPLSGPLRLGAIPTISPYLLPRMLRPLRDSYPHLRLILGESITAQTTARLLNHQLDAALLATPLEAPELTSIPLYREPFWLATPKGHPLASKARIDAVDLEQTSLLLLEDGHCLADQVLDLCRTDRHLHDDDMGDLRAASLDTLLELVGMGFGATLIPALALRPAALRELGIEVRPIAEEHASRTISLVYRRSFPRLEALQALVAVVRANLPPEVTPLFEEDDSIDRL